MLCRRAPALSLVLALPCGFALSAGCERTAYYSSSDQRPGPGSAASSAGAGAGATSGPTSGGGGPSGGTTRRAVLEAVAGCATSVFSSFEAAAADLETRAEEADSAPGAEAQEAARQAWREATGLWEQAELFRLGPAGPPTTPGGQRMGFVIYSWPDVSRCLVEQTLVSRAYEDPAFSSFALASATGLDAAEYLLFYEGADNACPELSNINSKGEWAALGEEELARRKRAYASVVAADVASRASKLADAWRPEGGDFAGHLARAGQEGSVYASEQAALNSIGAALMYLDTHVKDLKVGKPLGIIECQTNCGADAFESRYAKVSRSHLENNLVGFGRIMLGCEGEGDVAFDDLLVTIGAEALASRLREDVEAAIAAVQAIQEEDLAKVLAEDPAKLEVVHAAVKRITDVLKTEFVTVLDIQLPNDVATDND